MYKELVLAMLVVLSILWVGYTTVTSNNIVELVSTAGDYNTTHYIFHLKLEYPASSGNIYEAYAIIPKSIGYLEPFTFYINWSFSGSDMHSFWVFIDGGTYTSGSSNGEKYIRYDGWWELHPNEWNCSLYIKFDDKLNGPMAYTPSKPLSFAVPLTITDNSEINHGKLVLRIYSPNSTDIARVYVNGVKIFEHAIDEYYRYHVIDWKERYVRKADLDRAWVYAGEEFNINITVFDADGNLLYNRSVIYTPVPDQDDITIVASYKKPVANYPRLNIKIYDADPKDFPIIYRTYEITFLSPSYITVYPKNPDPYTSYRKATPFTLNITKGGAWDTGWYGGYGIQLTIVNEPKTIKFRIERVYDYQNNSIVINKTITLSLGESTGTGSTTTTTTTSQESREEKRIKQMICINDTKIFMEAVHLGTENNKNKYIINITRPIDTIVILEITGKGEIEIEGYGKYSNNATIVLNETNKTVSYDVKLYVPLRYLHIFFAEETSNTTDSLTVYSDSDITITIKEVIVNGTSYIVNETMELLGQAKTYAQSLWNKYGLLLIAVPVFFILLIILALGSRGRRR